MEVTNCSRVPSPLLPNPRRSFCGIWSGLPEKILWIEAEVSAGYAYDTPDADNRNAP